MPIKTINDNPKITDDILFSIDTPDASGCYKQNPYKIDKVVIYFAERDYSNKNYGTYQQNKVDTSLLIQLQAAQKAACDSPTQENLNKVIQIQSQITTSSQTNTFYYSDAVPVYTLGTTDNPAWLSTDTGNSYLNNDLDENQNAILGKFNFIWSPQGSVREGDYFICWTWTPLPAGDSLSQSIFFTLSADLGAVLSIPTHHTAPQKYEILLDRYLPETYKTTLSKTDITPQTLQKFSEAIAKGFTDLEDLANQLIDLYDANVVHESLLVYLADLFNLKLKSQDTTLWRRQIKQAIPLFKMKGTLKGLTEAFAQAGMTLNKYTRLWQVVSPYTWQQSFKVGVDPNFILERNILLPIDQNNFKLWVRRANSKEYISLSSDYVVFTSNDCDLNTVMTWVGDELSAGAMNLYEGDYLKILYQYRPIPVGYQALENYIQQLPLSDQRDEEDQDFPRKNWNVRLIEEDDPLFDTIIPSRQPFCDPVIFGKVRTEFPFSENIYNMDTYNGSERDTTEPCLIDKDFIDPCTACISSNFNVDVSVQDISNERIMEINDILEEYTPFHAVPHLISFSGEMNDIIQSPVEDIEFIAKYDYQEYVMSGEASTIFNRTIGDGFTITGPTKSQLAEQITMISDQIGTGYNNYVMLVAPNTNLTNVGINYDKNLLKILSPSANAGSYKLAKSSGNTAIVVNPIEPFSQSMFTFNLYNILYDTSTATITQDNLIVLSNSTQNLANFDIKSKWDINKNSYTGNAYTVYIPEYSETKYVINYILPNGQLVLLDPDRTLPTTNATAVNFKIYDNSNNLIVESSSGILTITKRALVNLNDSYISDISQFAKSGDILTYDNEDYTVLGTSGNNFYIQDYDLGDAVGVNIEILRPLILNSIGYFGYSGLMLETSIDYESNLGILNGENPPSNANDILDNGFLKENFLFKIGSNYFRLVDINKKTIVLGGQSQDWGTLASGGSSITFSILRFPKKSVDIMLTVFSSGIDRSGKETIIQEIDTEVPASVALTALQLPSDSNLVENIQQEEKIEFKIDWLDGRQETRII